MGKPIGVREVRARTGHVCFLCPREIAPGTVHKRWAWVEDGRIVTMRVHVGCDQYAQSEIGGWTNGDGCEEDAVYDSVHERLLAWADATVVGVDLVEKAEILKFWPELAGLVDLVVEHIEDEVRDDAEGGSQ